METMGLGYGWEDMPVGRRFKTVRRQITETDVVGFVSAVGMLEELFTAPAAAAARLVPAALIYSLAEGLVIQSTLQGVGVAFLGMELDVKGPTVVGDTIHVVCEVIEARESKGRPGHGLVRTRNEVVKDDGAVVLAYTPLRLLRGREALAADRA
jgi:acyl dehydratase